MTTVEESAVQFPELWAGRTLLTVLLSERARDRYQHALWYVWGRQDAGDLTTRDLACSHYLGADYGFAEFAALEAEAYEREQRTMLACVGDQYERFVHELTTRAVMS